nr:TonB-dependent receptor plug domain-containing protein [Sphingopyxis sp. PET50]
MMKRNHWVLLAGAAWLSVGSGAAWAQEATAEAGQADDRGQPQSSTRSDDERDSDIIVTARRRAERLQDVPVAVTAIKGDDIEKSTYKNLTDVQYLAPSVTVNNSLFYPTYQIRGVGTQTYDTGAEASVGIVVDGVADGNTRSIGINSLTDLDRIEVLRGPQGTLFGKNSSAGVIQIITKQPVIGEWNVAGAANYGSDDETVLSLAVNVPISSTLAARITGYYQHRDGYIDNYDGTKMGFQTDKGIRGKLMWQPSDAVTVTAIGYASRNDNTFGYGTLRNFGVATGPGSFRDIVGSLGIVPGPKNLDAAIFAGNTAYFHTNNQGGSLQADIDLGGGYTLTSISAYKGWNLGSQFPIVQAPVPYFDFNRGRGYHTDQWTQELRIQSPPNPLIFTVGLYFYNYKLRANQLQGGTFGLPTLPGMRYSGAGGEMHFGNENTSYAAFIDGTYRISDRLRVFAERAPDPRQGVREPQRDGGAELRRLRSAPAAVRGDGEGRRFLVALRRPVRRRAGRHALCQHVARLQGAGRGVAEQWRGQRGAARNRLCQGSRHQDDALRPQADAEPRGLPFEVQGLPGDDHRRFARSAAWAGFANARSLTAQGLEVEARLLVAKGFVLSVNGSLNDTEYGAIFTSCYPLQPVGTDPANGNCAPIPGAPGQNYASMKGLSLANTPRTAFTVSADYVADLSSRLRADFNLRYGWRDSVRSNPVDPNTRVPSYGMLNANMGVSAADGSWRLGLYARNLLKKRFVADIYATFFDDGGYTQNPTSEGGRTIGVSLLFKM